jgi:hypothetical protein
MSLASIPFDAATQAQMETGTSLVTGVVPGRQHNHPGHPKCWGRMSIAAGTPTLETNYNITSIADTSPGKVTVTIATDFSSSNWACNVAVGDGANAYAGSYSSQLAGSVIIGSSQPAVAYADPTDGYSMSGFGDQ